MRRKSLATLQREAARATRWRGHRLTWAITRDYRPGRDLALGTCRACGMDVQCDTKPDPNGIDIGGLAVALNCRPADLRVPR